MNPSTELCNSTRTIPELLGPRCLGEVVSMPRSGLNPRGKKAAATSAPYLALET